MPKGPQGAAPISRASRFRFQTEHYPRLIVIARSAATKQSRRLSATRARLLRLVRNDRASMSLAPLLAAPAVIQIHAFAAIGAFGLGAVQLAAPKGTIPHRVFGWVWATLLLVVAVSSFFIHEIRLWGPWSPIHLLSVFTLVMLPLAVLHARRHATQRHRNAMISIFLGALVIAGLFTFLPGRI